MLLAFFTLLLLNYFAVKDHTYYLNRSDSTNDDRFSNYIFTLGMTRNKITRKYQNSSFYRTHQFDNINNQAILYHVSLYVLYTFLGQRNPRIKFDIFGNIGVAISSLNQRNIIQPQCCSIKTVNQMQLNSGFPYKKCKTCYMCVSG